eukprot:m.729301 g.729301  ORF g.729301 m.729301 type:complete len:311 (-) comp58870_c0_seq97:330-1262(-)
MTALKNTIEPGNIKHIIEGHQAAIPVLTREFVSDSINLTNANVTIRWFMLHAHGDLSTPFFLQGLQPTSDQVLMAFRGQEVFYLLSETSQLEYVLLKEKEAKWAALRHEASDRMKELSEVFAGKTPLSRVEKSEMLQKYFEKLSEQIAALEHDDSTAAGRKITNLIAALDDVQEFHQLQNSLQIRQFLTETQLSLKQMLRVINIQCDFIEALQSILDLSYVWLIIDNYTSFMQAAVKRDPAIVIKLRATFLKLAAAIEIPVLRMLSSTARILRALWTTTALRLSPMSARCCKLFLPPCSRFWPRSFRRNG